MVPIAPVAMTYDVEWDIDFWFQGRLLDLEGTKEIHLKAKWISVKYEKELVNAYNKTVHSQDLQVASWEIKQPSTSAEAHLNYPSLCADKKGHILSYKHIAVVIIALQMQLQAAVLLEMESTLNYYSFC